MTPEFINLLTRLSELMHKWNAEEITSEEELIKQLKAILLVLIVELPRQKIEEVPANEIGKPEDKKEE